MVVEAESSDSRFTARIRRLLATASPRVRVLLYLTLVLTGAGAVAELVTIGAVFPILAVAATPGSAANVPVLGPLLTTLSQSLDVSPILAAALVLIAAAVTATTVRLVLAWVSQKFIYGLERDLVMEVYRRSLRQPYSWYVKQNSSVLMAGLEKITNVIIGVVAPLVQATTSAIMASCIIIFLVMIDPGTTLVAAFSIGLIYLVISLVARGRLRKVSDGIADIYAARIKIAQETLGGIRDIILDQSQHVYETKRRRLEDRYCRLWVIANLMGMAPRLLIEGTAVVLVAGAAVWFSQKPGGIIASIPILGAFALGAQRLLPMIQSVYLGWNGYSVHEASVRDVIELLEAPVESADEHRGRDTVRPFREVIALRNASFAYSTGPNALSDIEMSISKGERIGLIGKTGCGKSTLVDILMGLLPPTTGELSVDGETIGDSNLANWKAQIAHVPQAIFLADDSIAANIAIGEAEENVDLARVEDAARQAGLIEFVSSLPDGLATTVGERGIRLSGGQRQRIGLARALYKKASVLVLDEATSALDDETEAAVMESVAGLGPDLTVILIAHRLSTVSTCDRIYRLGGGRIIQLGSFEEVVGGIKPAEPGQSRPQTRGR